MTRKFVKKAELAADLFATATQHTPDYRSAIGLIGSSGLAGAALGSAIGSDNPIGRGIGAGAGAASGTILGGIGGATIGRLLGHGLAAALAKGNQAAAEAIINSAERIGKRVGQIGGGIGGGYYGFNFARDLEDQFHPAYTGINSLGYLPRRSMFYRYKYGSLQKQAYANALQQMSFYKEAVPGYSPTGQALAAWLQRMGAGVSARMKGLGSRVSGLTLQDIAGAISRAGKRVGGTAAGVVGGTGDLIHDALLGASSGIMPGPDGRLASLRSAIGKGGLSTADFVGRHPYAVGGVVLGVPAAYLIGRTMFGGKEEPKTKLDMAKNANALQQMSFYKEAVPGYSPTGRALAAWLQRMGAGVSAKMRGLGNLTSRDIAGAIGEAGKRIGNMAVSTAGGTGDLIHDALLGISSGVMPGPDGRLASLRSAIGKGGLSVADFVGRYPRTVGGVALGIPAAYLIGRAVFGGKEEPKTKSSMTKNALSTTAINNLAAREAQRAALGYPTSPQHMWAMHGEPGSARRADPNNPMNIPHWSSKSGSPNAPNNQRRPGIAAAPAVTATAPAAATATGGSAKQTQVAGGSAQPATGGSSQPATGGSAQQAQPATGGSAQQAQSATGGSAKKTQVAPDDKSGGWLGSLGKGGLLLGGLGVGGIIGADLLGSMISRRNLQDYHNREMMELQRLAAADLLRRQQAETNLIAAPELYGRWVGA
jgi:hypothetical protein